MTNQFLKPSLIKFLKIWVPHFKLAGISEIKPQVPLLIIIDTLVLIKFGLDLIMHQPITTENLQMVLFVLISGVYTTNCYRNYLKLYHRNN